MAFINGFKATISTGDELYPYPILAWMKEEGVLTPIIVQPTQTRGGHPDAARASNGTKILNRDGVGFIEVR